MRRALVISGGGNKGPFAVGVLDYIFEKTDLKFDIYAGSSAGSLVNSTTVIDKFEDVKKTHLKVTNDMIFKKKGTIVDVFATKNSLLTFEPLKILIDGLVPEDIVEQINNLNRVIVFSTVCIESGKIVYFTNQPNILRDDRFDKDYYVKEINNKKQYCDALYASSCQPVVTDFVKIDGENYTDGGLREYLPLMGAIENLRNEGGEIFTIILSPNRPIAKDGPFESFSDRLSRTIDLFCTDVALNDLNLANNEIETHNRNNPTKEIRLFIFQNETDIIDNSLTFSPTISKKMIKLGRAKAQQIFNSNDYLKSLLKNPNI